jgi:hypothetical protein
MAPFLMLFYHRADVQALPALKDIFCVFQPTLQGRTVKIARTAV